VEDGRAKLRLIVDEWKKIVCNFESLADEHQRRSTDEIKYRVSISEAVGEIQESVAEGDRKTQLLTVRIGSEPKSSEEDGGSLWEAIQEALAKGQTKVEVIR
jgi:hypothetical protein